MVWLNVLPLVLLAIYLAGHHLHTLYAQQNREAGDQARNVATAIDKTLHSQIAALQLLAASPLLDDPLRLPECYKEALAFHENFGGHVIFADLSMQMLFNTRVPFGSTLPKLPRPQGHAAAPAALATKQPAVGDMFLGPIANETLVAVAVPVLRDGHFRGLLLSILETRQLQLRLDAVALPEDWSLTLIDGKNAVMARRASSAASDRPFGRSQTRSHVAQLTTSAWSVVLEMPGRTYYSPLVITSAALAVAIFATALIGIVNGRRA
ncbi:MAG: hypothetical protein A2005_08080 [Desulfuromonadales bacterium GWC2_61_20]|nr:MAG: hypothetical protein A2005_08080 [Desulfuromonadales bacterium GWC2_61_20]